MVKRRRDGRSACNGNNFKADALLGGNGGLGGGGGGGSASTGMEMGRDLLRVNSICRAIARQTYLPWNIPMYLCILVRSEEILSK